MSILKSPFSIVADFSGSNYTTSPSLISFLFTSASYINTDQSGSLAHFRTNTISSSVSGAAGTLSVVVSDPTDTTNTGSEAIRFGVQNGEPRVGIGFPLSYTPSNAFEVSGSLSVDGPENSHIEVGTYNVGYDLIELSNFTITGSGLIVSGAMADDDHHNFLKIGDVELVDINNLITRTFLIHNVEDFLIASGADGGNITTNDILLRHKGNEFIVKIDGDVNNNAISATPTSLVLKNNNNITLDTGVGALFLKPTNATLSTGNYILFQDAEPNAAPQEIKYTALSNVLPQLRGDLNCTDITASNNISASGDITASAFSGDGSGLTGILTTTGTPADNQIAIFTDSNTIEGDSGLTYNGTILTVESDISASGDIITTETGSFGRIEIDDTIQAANFTGSFLRLDQDGDGFRMTNRGAFEADGTDFKMFATNNNLKFSTDGSSGTRLTLGSNANGGANFTTNITSSGHISSSGQLIGDVLHTNTIEFNTGSATISLPQSPSNTSGNSLEISSGQGNGAVGLGGNLTLRGGKGSGSGNGGSVIIRGGAGQSSGSFQVYTPNLEINSNGDIDTNGNITSSNSISASDTVHAKFLRIPQANGGSDSSIYFGSGPADDNGVIYDDGSDLIIGYNDTDLLSINNTRAKVTGGFEVAGTQGSITASNDISASGLVTSLSASIDHVLVNNKLQGNGSGFQFFAFNEDTIKVKFANWYSSNDRQYGMGQLWYETWFAAIDNQAGRDNRRIGFYLEEPDAGSTDSGTPGQHPSNARFYVDITGSYVNSGSLTVTDANFKVSSSGDITAQGRITTSGLISSSKSIIGTSFSIGDQRFAEASGEQLRINEAAHFTDGVQINRGSLPQPFTVNGTTVTLNGGITASTTISASGDLFASAIKSQDYFVVSRSSAFTNNEFLVADGAGGVESTDALAVSASNLGIGVAKPEVRLHMLGEAAQTTQILMEQFNDTADAPDIRTRRYRGTSASRADVQAGDYLFRLNVHGQDDGSSELYGSMQFDVDSSDQDALVWNIETRDTTGTLADRLTIDKDGDATFSGNLAINGIANVSESIASIPSSYRVLLQSNFFHGQTTLRYMPFNNTGEQSGFNYISITPAAADGRLISVTVWPQSNGGSTIIGLHINSNSTAATTDTQTLSIGAPTTFTFSSNNTFSQNDELSISFDPTTSPNGISAQIILEYDY